MRAEGFFYNLDIPVLYGDLEIGKLQFLIKNKNKKHFSAVIFSQFFVIKALDPDWIRIRIRIDGHPKMLDPDPDPDEMNADPQPCLARAGFFPSRSELSIGNLEAFYYLVMSVIKVNSRCVKFWLQQVFDPELDLIKPDPQHWLLATYIIHFYGFYGALHGVFSKAVLRIRYVYPGSEFFIPNPGSKRFWIRIHIKDFNNF